MGVSLAVSLPLRNDNTVGHTCRLEVNRMGIVAYCPNRHRIKVKDELRAARESARSAASASGSHRNRSPSFPLRRRLRLPQRHPLPESLAWACP
jgi:hypothetical protein